MASLKARTVILTGAIAGITATGAILGGQMKDDWTSAQKSQEVREMTAKERIAILEARKATLIKQRDEWRRKLDNLETKMQEEHSRLKEQD